MNKSAIIGLVLTICMVLIAVFGFLFGNDLNDYFKARNFVPNEKISAIVSKIKPTNKAKNIFYATNPQVLSANDFNSNCARNLEKTTILGCYKADSIFIFDIENNDLNGVEEVTAAHELLHAVWQRMNVGQKNELGKKLREDYERLKTPELEKTMAMYAESQPGEHENELHSILGTEFKNLSPELESHYAIFFENRQEIAEMSSKYKAKFKELENRAEALNSELESMKAQINAKIEDYEAKFDSLNSRINDFNYRADNGYFSNQGTFQAERNSLLNRQNYLENYRVDINAEVDNFNSKVQELSNISGQIQKLYDSMNSRLDEVKSVELN